MELFNIHNLLPDADHELLEWSKKVKVAAHWTCQVPDCGITERNILDAHHIEPVSVCPERKYDVANGQCLCLWHHAVRHSGLARILIIIRLLTIEIKRLAARKDMESI